MIEEIGHEICRLSAASNFLSMEKILECGVVSHLIDVVSNLEVNGNHCLEEGKKENDCIYLTRVPHTISFMALLAAFLVNPFNFFNVLDVSQEKVFC